MKFSSRYLLALLLVALVSLATAQKKKAVATIFKPVGNVDYKTEKVDWAKAKPATPLASGDIVRTQENSFAIVKFLENSVLRVQEKSEVTVSGNIAKNREFSRNVYLQKGELGFDVKKRPNEKFEFSTPTSVASIRGTGGLLIAGLDSNDILILASGIIDFKNLLSNFSITVKGGQTAFSSSDGTIKVKESTPEEKRSFKQTFDDTTKTEGSRLPDEQQDTTSTSTTGITIGITINAPVTRENQAMIVTVEITQSSVAFDSLKKIVSDFTFYYRSKSDQPFKQLKRSLTERTTKFTIPAADVFAPSLEAYAVLKLRDGSEFSSPTTTPDTTPHSFVVQAGQKNELRIEFTDPSGKKKTMIIEYK